MAGEIGEISGNTGQNTFYPKQSLNLLTMETFVPSAYDQSVFEGLFVMNDATVRIIVGVDDDFRMRESLESLIESAGLIPLVFPSAAEFLRSGKLAEASCLITDVRMPGMDGIELQLLVKSERPRLPLIFVSGHF